MKVLAVDIQGFNLALDKNESSFVIKELAITNGEQTSHYVFESPQTYSSLSHKDKRNANFATYRIHGLQYSSGYVNYDKVDDIIEKMIHAADIVYVRGYQKKDFLEDAFSRINVNQTRLPPKIVNIETLDVWGPTLPQLEPNTPKCMAHLPDKLYRCSLRNCNEIHDWIYNYMPT